LNHYHSKSNSRSHKVDLAQEEGLHDLVRRAKVASKGGKCDKEKKNLFRKRSRLIGVLLEQLMPTQMWKQNP